MTKKVPVVTVAERDEAARLAGLPVEATLALTDVAGAIREGLLAFSAATGLLVMRQMMEGELTARIGPKHAKLPDRVGNWHGTTTGSVVMGGRKLPVERPRGRNRDSAEIELDTWATFSSEELLCQLVVERMLAGVATRRHVDVAEPLGADVEAKATATSKSAVSRRFVTATEHALEQLLGRDLSELEAAVLMVDGLDVAGACVVAALVITADGTKVPVGLWLGDTENKTVVTAVLADMVDRGLCFDNGLLVVLDGARALAAGVRKVFGERAVIQRCVLHKRRNVSGHLPDELAHTIDRRLALAFGDPDWRRGLAAAKSIAASLDANHPNAAGSLREGLEDMFTVRRLGISGRLALTLTSTNPIESMISIGRTTMGRVKKWKDGSMKKRWCAAGMLEAERSFRRVKGHAEMPKLIAALRHHTNPATSTKYDQAA